MSVETLSVRLSLVGFCSSELLCTTPVGLYLPVSRDSRFWAYSDNDCSPSTSKLLRLHLILGGFSYRAIGARVQWNSSTVMGFWKQWTDEHRTIRKTGSG
ncbi:hypothetical protein TNCV_331441 [Trichonephila clavipes]|nr:hypothetical protein TNCV_331441 [Trichonephila clavipes]